jgi:quinol monooxygenase YgiN
MLNVIAAYRVNPADADAVAKLLAEHAAASESEPGCRQFLAHQAQDDPGRFYLYETYDSEDAFEEHRHTPHFRRNIQTTLAPLLIEREWHICTPPLRTS